MHPEVVAKYYGCGIVLPLELEGRRVLDLGSGSGRDVYILAQLVGGEGEVVGVDMTDEQLETANAHLSWHRERFGRAGSKISFRKGYIEQLDATGLEPGSFDVIVSNCVINLSIDKPAVFRGAHALLKPGGELYFADVYCDRRLADSVRSDPVLYGECLGGALYWNDFLPMAKAAGLPRSSLGGEPPYRDHQRGLAREARRRSVFLGDLPAVQARRSRAGLRGLRPGRDLSRDRRRAADVFDLDGHHAIERGKVFTVCGNTWRMLAETRFAPHFDFIGDFSTHYGIFPGCGTDIPFAAADAPKTGSGSCC